MKDVYNNGENVKIGNRYINGRGCVFEVIEFIENVFASPRYRVRFINTGYETTAEPRTIKRGYVKDPYYPSYFNIGYIGEPRKKYTVKIRSLWERLMYKCYDSNYKAYPQYGAKGVTVCERWLSFANFLDDFEKIDGYDEKLFNERKLELDKDKKQINIPYDKTVYSLETCTFLSSAENIQYRSKRYDKDADISKYKINDRQYKILENDENIGKEFLNKKGQLFKIISVSRPDGYQKRYKVKFINTGYETDVKPECAKCGVVKDYFEPAVYGVGYLGNMTSTFGKTYQRWKTIIRQCYSESSPSYRFYGAKGITVCDRWKCYEYFVIDMKFIKGYNEGVLNTKDFLLSVIPGYNYYSLETCQFIYNPTKEVLNPLGVINNGIVTKFDNMIMCSKNLNLPKEYIIKSMSNKEAKFMYIAMERIPKPNSKMAKGMCRIPEFNSQMKKAMTRV